MIKLNFYRDLTNVVGHSIISLSTLDFMLFLNKKLLKNRRQRVIRKS